MLVLITLVTLFAGVLALGVARLGTEAVAAAQAQTAADAVALAAALDSDDAAETARANGARVLRLRRDGTRVCVAIRRGRAEASACARRYTEHAGADL